MLDLIKRIAPDIADTFVIEEKDDSFFDCRYEIESSGNKIILRGKDKTSLAMAFGKYLKEVCHIDLSRSGAAQITIKEAPVDFNKITVEFPNEKRLCYNFHTYASELCFKDWSYWESELDRLAMSGINMPLLITGYEAVWYYACTGMGINREDALNYISGPAYWPWQITDNLESFLSLVDIDYLKKRVELARKIISRAKELGMEPVFPCFTGQVPKFIKNYFRKAKLFPVSSACGFAPTYHISPDDPFFVYFGSELMKKQKELFGECRYFSCAPYLGNEPLKAGDFFWQAEGKAVYECISSVCEDAVWIVPAESVRKEMVETLNKENLLIIDSSGRYADQTDGFWGYDFISGISTNTAGRTQLSGDFAALCANPFKNARNKYKNAVGTGIFSDSLCTNPMITELGFDMLTRKDSADPDSWIKSYIKRRWQNDSDSLFKAAKLLTQSCYSVSSGKDTASLVCARPSTELLHTAPDDVMEIQYDNSLLFEAVKILLTEKDSNSEGLEYDVCDILRQALSNKCMETYFDAMKGFSQRDARLYEHSSNEHLKLLHDIDRLLLTRKEFTLATYLKQAGDSAVTRTEKKNFEINLLTYITIWGPFSEPYLYDYAWKEWGGLIESYYCERWHKFYKYLAEGFPSRKEITTRTKKQINGRNEYYGNKFFKYLAKFENKWISTYYPPKQLKDEDKKENDEPGTLDIADELIKKYPD